ncbi:MAG: DUF378 domain-containing protein [Candidatus Moranbacteria bacterium]|nr:DUF378 domain-containing protein [Candidatus Moranbacteria bacterium]
MKTVKTLAYVLVVVGGLNWGLVGLFEFNLVAFLFETMPMIMKTVYVLVALSAVYVLVDMFKEKG